MKFDPVDNPVVLKLTRNTWLAKTTGSLWKGFGGRVEMICSGKDM